MGPFKDHFSEVAGSYAAYRPTYPTEMIRHLASLAPGRESAWDCATGNGQAAVLLADQFDRVLASDASADQIAHAAAHPRVTYRVALAQDSALPDASVDLVTVAQALHWLDRPRFYPEVHRVLKSRGILAVWAYASVEIDPEVDRVVRWFYRDRVGRYWPPERRHTENGYQDLDFPFEELPGGAWAMRTVLDRRGFLGYIGTWSSVRACRAMEGRDPIEELEAALAPHWKDPSERREMISPVLLRVGRRRQDPPA